ncbi:MAG: acetyl-CoA carboxylase biotin carboxyl carrier protein [Candidatus Kapaibacteriales bacterium]
MDLEYLEKLLSVFDASSATELEIDEEEISIRVSKQNGESSQVVYANAPQAMPQVQQSAHAQQSAPSEGPAPAKSNLHEVTSPIVGTFYRSPAPDADPFVEVGSRVSKGTTLCIVEAMKLMNEIESDENGIIEEICLSDAEAVEFGQLLFRIKPD